MFGSLCVLMVFSCTDLELDLSTGFTQCTMNLKPSPPRTNHSFPVHVKPSLCTVSAFLLKRKTENLSSLPPCANHQMYGRNGANPGGNRIAVTRPGVDQRTADFRNWPLSNIRLWSSSSQILDFEVRDSQFLDSTRCNVGNTSTVRVQVQNVFKTAARILDFKLHIIKS